MMTNVEANGDFSITTTTMKKVVEVVEFVDYRGMPGKTWRFENGVQVNVTHDYHSGAKLTLITNKPVDETYKRPWVIRTSPQWVYLNSHAMYGDMFRTILHTPAQWLFATPPAEWSEGIVRSLNFLSIGAQSEEEDKEVRLRRDKALSHIGDVIYDERLDQLQTTHELVELSQLVYFTCLGQGRAEFVYTMIPILSRIVDFVSDHEKDHGVIDGLRPIIMSIFGCETHPVVGDHRWGYNGSFLVPVPKGWREQARGHISDLITDLMVAVSSTATTIEQSWPTQVGTVVDRACLIDELLILSLRLFAGYMKWMPEKKQTAASKPTFQTYRKHEGPVPQPMDLVLGAETITQKTVVDAPVVTSKGKNKKAARQEKRVGTDTAVKSGPPKSVKLSELTSAEVTPADITADLAESIGDPAYHEPASEEAIQELANMVNN